MCVSVWNYELWTLDNQIFLYNEEDGWMSSEFGEHSIVSCSLAAEWEAPEIFHSPTAGLNLKCNNPGKWTVIWSGWGKRELRRRSFASSKEREQGEAKNRGEGMGPEREECIWEKQQHLGPQEKRNGKTPRRKWQAGVLRGRKSLSPEGLDVKKQKPPQTYFLEKLLYNTIKRITVGQEKLGACQDQRWHIWGLEMWHVFRDLGTMFCFSLCLSRAIWSLPLLFLSFFKRESMSARQLPRDWRRSRGREIL